MPFAEYIEISKNMPVRFSKELTHSIALNGKYKSEFFIVTCWQSASIIVFKNTPIELMRINERAVIFKVFKKLEFEFLSLFFVKVWPHNEQKLDAEFKELPQFRH